MGNKLFGKDIAGALAKRLGPLLLPMTLTRITSGARDVADPTAGTNPSETDHACRGIVEDYADSQYDGTIVKRGDRKALILGDTIQGGAVPEPSDRLTAEGVTYEVIGVKRDPDAATYTCQVRGA